MMKQFLLTPAAGKRLIARALAQHPSICRCCKQGTLVIIAGTTNGYVAEELLLKLGQRQGFSRKTFFRGIILPPNQLTTESGRIPDTSHFLGDVIIRNGKWLTGKTIFDVADELEEGDVILKGANALDLNQRRAGIFIGDPRGGTIVESLRAVVGRRVELIIPVGLEKRINSSLDEIARKLNVPGENGPRFLPVTGEIFTEMEAIKLLTGCSSELIASGGVSGAEGSVWLAVSGEEPELVRLSQILDSIVKEPQFIL